jgi:ribosome-associated protein
MSGARRSPGPGADSRQKAIAVARAAIDKQADSVVIMDLRSLSSVTDFFVVCTAGSSRQLDALADHLEQELDRLGAPVWHIEGTTAQGATEPQWVLMDAGDVVVHLLDQQAREFYRLEDLWADAPRLAIPQDS